MKSMIDYMDIRVHWAEHSVHDLYPLWLPPCPCCSWINWVYSEICHWICCHIRRLMCANISKRLWRNGQGDLWTYFLGLEMCYQHQNPSLLYHQPCQWIANGRRYGWLGHWGQSVWYEFTWLIRAFVFIRFEWQFFKQLLGWFVLVEKTSLLKLIRAYNLIIVTTIK